VVSLLKGVSFAQDKQLHVEAVSVRCLGFDMTVRFVGHEVLTLM